MGDSATFLSVHFLPSFIEAYRNHQCLWRVKSKDYTNRRMKDAAYNDLLTLTKSVVPDCSMSFIKRKIDMLRGNYRREAKKVHSTIKAGTTVYKPKLWYYNLLTFLHEQEETQDSTSTQDIPTEEEGTESELVQSEEEQTLNEEDVKTTPPSTIIPSYGRKKRARQLDESSNVFLERSLPLFENKEDEYDKVGANVAAKLRKMEPIQSMYAENLINQILFGGMLNKLQEGSFICYHPTFEDGNVPSGNTFGSASFYQHFLAQPDHAHPNLKNQT